MFDEPSSYLDVKQRLKAAEVIRKLLKPDIYVIVVEHDLSVLDYLSDFICCLYGVPGAYGVVTLPFSVREGINVFLAGFIPTENLRFRDFALSFKVKYIDSIYIFSLLLFNFNYLIKLILTFFFLFFSLNRLHKMKVMKKLLKRSSQLIIILILPKLWVTLSLK
jgi:translation initiation factor RLI1